MLKCRTAENNDLESTYTKSSIFVANSLTHYKNLLNKSRYFIIQICYPNLLRIFTSKDTQKSLSKDINGLMP